MRQTLTAAVVVLALMGVGACQKNLRLEQLATQQAVVLQLYMDDQGACKLTQKTPGKVQTAPGRGVKWFVVGQCKGATVGIERMLTKEGTPYDPWRPGADLQGRAPGPGTPGAYVILDGTIRNDVAPGLYKYQVLIDGAPADYNPRADPGDFEVCPRWPCDAVSF